MSSFKLKPRPNLIKPRPGPSISRPTNNNKVIIIDSDTQKNETLSSGRTLTGECISLVENDEDEIVLTNGGLKQQENNLCGTNNSQSSSDNDCNRGNRTDSTSVINLDPDILNNSGANDEQKSELLNNKMNVASNNTFDIDFQRNFDNSRSDEDSFINKDGNLFPSQKNMEVSPRNDQIMCLDEDSLPRWPIPNPVGVSQYLNRMYSQNLASNGDVLFVEKDLSPSLDLGTSKIDDDVQCLDDFKLVPLLMGEGSGTEKDKTKTCSKNDDDDVLCLDDHPAMLPSIANDPLVKLLTEEKKVPLKSNVQEGVTTSTKVEKKINLNMRKAKPSLKLTTSKNDCSKPKVSKDVGSVSKKPKQINLKTSMKAENRNNGSRREFDIVNVRYVSMDELKIMKYEFEHLSKIYRNKKVYKNLPKKLANFTVNTDVNATVGYNNAKRNKRITAACKNKPAHIVKVHFNCWPKEWKEANENQQLAVPDNTSFILLRDVERNEFPPSKEKTLFLDCNGTKKPSLDPPPERNVAPHNSSEKSSAGSKSGTSEKKSKAEKFGKTEENETNESEKNEPVKNELEKNTLKIKKIELEKNEPCNQTRESDDVSIIEECAEELKKGTKKKDAKGKQPKKGSKRKQSDDKTINKKKKKPLMTGIIEIDDNGDITISEIPIPTEPKKRGAPGQLKTKPAPKVGKKTKKALEETEPSKPKTYYGKMCYEMKKNYEDRFGRNKTPDVAKLRMRDLMFYNPTTNPMKKGPDEKIIIEMDTTSEDQDDDDEDNEEDDDVSIVPQLKVGPDGQIIIDPASMPSVSRQVRRPVTRTMTEPTPSTSWAQLKSNRSREARRSWSHEETIKFYKALHRLGADFSTMEPLFPNRSRKTLKYKFKREEKVNGYLIDKVLSNPASFNFKALEKELERDQRRIDKAKNRANNLKQIDKKSKRNIPNPRNSSRFDAICSFAPDIPVTRHTEPYSAVPYQALYEDSMTLLKSVTKNLKGRRFEMLDDLYQPSAPRSGPSRPRYRRRYRPNGGRSWTRVDSKVIVIDDEVEEIDSDSSCDLLEDTTAKASTSAPKPLKTFGRPTSSLKKNTVKATDAVDSIYISGDDSDTDDEEEEEQEEPSAVVDDDDDSECEELMFINDLGHVIKKKKEANFVNLKRKSTTELQPNRKDAIQYKSLQEIVADGLLPDNTDEIDYTPPAKKEILINTNMLYNGVHFEKYCSYETDFVPPADNTKFGCSKRG